VKQSNETPNTFRNLRKKEKKKKSSLFDFSNANITITLPIRSAVRSANIGSVTYGTHTCITNELGLKTRRSRVFSFGPNPTCRCRGVSCSSAVFSGRYTFLFGSSRSRREKKQSTTRSRRNPSVLAVPADGVASRETRVVVSIAVDDFDGPVDGKTLRPRVRVTVRRGRRRPG